MSGLSAIRALRGFPRKKSTTLRAYLLAINSHPSARYDQCPLSAKFSFGPLTARGFRAYLWRVRAVVLGPIRENPLANLRARFKQCHLKEKKTK
jgi:hypothetical protein